MLLLDVQNAGKSTALNALTNQKKLSQNVKKHLVVHSSSIFLRWSRIVKLVDLPGYGYAAVPEKMKIEWQKSLGEYLQKRECLGGLVVLMDIRHPLKRSRSTMIEWAVSSDLPVMLLLTKADKLSQSARSKQVKMVREAIFTLPR